MKKGLSLSDSVPGRSAGQHSSTVDTAVRACACGAGLAHQHLFESKKSVGVVFLHACARTDQSVSKIIIFKSAAGSISFRSTVSQSCSIHACVGGHRRAAAAPRLLRWRCRRLAAALAMRLVGDIRHATAVFHKVFGQENKPGAPVTSSQGARDTNVRPPNRAWEERARPPRRFRGKRRTSVAPSGKSNASSEREAETG